MSAEVHASVKVRTTLPKRPLPPNSQRAAIRTARLVARPFTQDDLQGFHVLRTQPEVMKFTAVGRVDRDLAETQARLDLFLTPNDAESFNFAICLLDTGELVGVGGMFKLSFSLGWPEAGYMLKREHWGKGYATEFMKGFLQAYWALEREEVEVEVDAESVYLSPETNEVPMLSEKLVAMVEANNPGSLRVMEKGGFKKFKTWVEPDSRAGFEGSDVTLIGFAVQKGDSNL